MNRQRPQTLIKLTAVIIILMMVFQLFQDLDHAITQSGGTFAEWLWEYRYVKPVPVPLKDNPDLYGNDEADVSVESLYVTVLPDGDDPDTAMGFAAMNAITSHDRPVPVFRADVRSSPDPAIRGGHAGMLQDISNESSESPSATPGNATLTLRGQSSYLSMEKSYKIQFDKNGETWHGFRTLSLNKHPFDYSRFRNKLAYDLFERVPDFNSLRTRWVRLFVCDLTSGESGGSDRYDDYGLYEFIELTNEQYLRDRGLDPNGIVFKAQFNEFFRYEDAIRQTDDPLFNQSDFDFYLELKAGEPRIANRKLIRMLEDINNERLDIDQVFDFYFNRDNYFTYLALHILLGNFDSQERNYYLYSPHDMTTWYFLPWDYDKSLGADIVYDKEGNPANLIGISHYWGVVLHNRIFRKAHNVEELNRKIEMIYALIYPGAINQIIDKYLPVVEKYALDDLLRYEKVDREDFLQVVSRMRSDVAYNRMKYYETLEKPMPVYLGEVELTEEGYRFGWSESFDLQGDAIQYQLQISRDPAFNDLIFEKSRMTASHYYLMLEPGRYFWRVVIRDVKGNEQRAFDEYNGDEGHYYGLKTFTIG